MTKSAIYLRESATGKHVQATLCDEVSDEHLKMWEATWRPAMEAHCAKRTYHDTPEDAHWDWKTKATGWRSMVSSHSFAIVCRAELQGLMWASDIESARLAAQFGKPLVYVKYLATAPWNRPEVQKPPRYRGVGTVLIAAAMQLSLDLEYEGRIGLHSLPAAERFYQNTFGMRALGRDAACEDLMYFEMTEVQAKLFHRDRRKL